MKIMSFNNFFHKYGLKNKTTTNITFQIVLLSLSLNGTGTYLGDGPFESDTEIVNLDP